jgi:hypothetical protein
MDAQERPEDEIQSWKRRVLRSTAGRPRAWRRDSASARGSVLLSLLVLAVIVILAGVARTSAGRGATASLGVRINPEPYTALSFVGPGVATLGFSDVRYHRAQVHDRFSFRITNAEHRAQHYAWTIAFDPAGRSYHGSVSLHSGTSRTVTSTVLFPCDAEVTPARRHPHLVRVRVSLQPSHESIDFLQKCDD